ncbi:MAG: MBL fold metallo-hydrolase [Lachnospiraceae bacterium]|nr:MBL fold metallo-hydrolase [Lachnospiraceae bacterium]
MKITVLGARGSIPVAGEDFDDYGGATSCVMVNAGGNTLFLDAGTGITAASSCEGNISILITHPHLDHLLGLPFFPHMMEKGRRIDIYATVKNGLGAKDQIMKLISEPLWPCTPSDYPADIVFHDLSLPQDIGGIKVSGIETGHPGGSTVFRLEHEGSSFVYATDYEHSDENDAELAKLCQGASLLFYDGQYTEEEYAHKKGYGHSTPAHGMNMAGACGVKTLRIVHHDPFHTDDQLTEMENEIKSENAGFARQGETIWLH